MLNLFRQPRDIPGGHQVNGEAPPRSSMDATAPYPLIRKSPGVPLSAVDVPGYRFQLLTPLVLIGLGTTGSRIVARIVSELTRHLPRFPESLAAIRIDGAHPKRPARDCHHIPLGLNGAGSDPNVGRRAFLDSYDRIRHAVEQSLLDLNHLDSLAPAKTSLQQATTFYLFAGNGGSSGGMQEPAVDLCHHVGHRINIHQIRVNQVTLGADMPTRDVQRSVSSEQKHTIPQTAADNLARWLADHHSSERMLIQPPGDAAFSIRRCDRIWRMLLLDQSNGTYQCATTEEFLELVACHFLGSLVTDFQAGVEDRFADHDRLQGNLRGGEVRSTP